MYLFSTIEEVTLTQVFPSRDISTRLDAVLFVEGAAVGVCLNFVLAIFVPLFRRVKLWIPIILISGASNTVVYWFMTNDIFPTESYFLGLATGRVVLLGTVGFALRHAAIQDKTDPLR
jgi:hypothetical protein